MMLESRIKGAEEMSNNKKSDDDLEKETQMAVKSLSKEVLQEPKMIKIEKRVELDITKTEKDIESVSDDEEMMETLI
uniref:Uncharacterized protein n=1 Tax=Romanomermis culicivorax TaxID=13658 RepID=A0A915KIF9_ROMCU